MTRHCWFIMCLLRPSLVGPGRGCLMFVGCWLLVVCLLLVSCLMLVGWTRPIWPGIVDLSCVCSGHQTSNEFWSGAAHSSEADQANSQTQRWKTIRTQRRKKKENKEILNHNVLAGSSINTLKVTAFIGRVNNRTKTGGNRWWYMSSRAYKQSELKITARIGFVAQLWISQA